MTIKAVIQVPEFFRTKAAFAIKTLLSASRLTSEIIFIDLETVNIPKTDLYYGLTPERVKGDDTIIIKTSIEALRFFDSHEVFIPKDIHWIESKGAKVPLLFLEETNAKHVPLSDIVATSFFFLSDWQTYTAVSRDQHGRLPYNKFIQAKLGCSDVPIVDVYARILFDAIQTHKPAIKSDNFWNGKKFAAVITHDFDRIRKNTPGIYFRDYVEIPMFNKLNLPPKERIKRLNTSVKALFTLKDGYRESIRKILSYHKSHDSKPTVLLKSILKRHPNDAKDYLNDVFMDEILSSVKNLNGEIGLHSSYDAGYDESLFQNEKKQLEKRVEKLIVSHRHHYLRYNQSIGLDIAIKSGILADSTLGWAEAPGYRTGTALPHFVFDNQNNTATQLLQIPLTLMDMQFSKYMETSAAAGVDFASKQVNTAEEFGGLVVWNFHHHIYDEAEFPDGAFLFENSLNYLTDKKPLFLTMGEVYELYKEL
jgi:hypothetical protein